ncbi:hypothetical protein CMI48_02015 [Candidatus Pacearchaeota archaeon]|nr:hypothetical protein [Candidatus Pacearchaeota archaeon]|tara:strand:- start:793 stop:1062 length:270 start_codon:yes stop_codon:yes gene_type:complete
MTYLTDLAVYIKKNLKKGYTKDSLRVALLNQGHSRTEIERAFKRVDEELADQAPVLKTKPRITYEIVEPEELATTVTNKKESFWKGLFS